jgi:hypothetical protein
MSLSPSDEMLWINSPVRFWKALPSYFGTFCVVSDPLFVLNVVCVDVMEGPQVNFEPLPKFFYREVILGSVFKLFTPAIDQTFKDSL